METDADESTTVSAKGAAISDFADAGYALIPLRGKTPTIKNWTTTPVGKYGVEELAGCNYGVVLDDETLVIDIDPRNFKPGDKPLTRLMTDLSLTQENLNSFTVQTGGGGAHIYLSVPKGFVCVNDLPEYPGIEFKGLGRQVVGPGSVHPDTGREYSVAAGSPDIRTPAAPALLEAIKARVQEPQAPDTGTGAPKDDVGAQERYHDYLINAAKPSIEGQNGNNNAFLVAAVGRDFGLSAPLTHALMMEHWNPRCQPQWHSEELADIVKNAYKYAEGPLGGSHPDTDFDTVPLEAQTPPPAEDDELPWDTTAQGAARVNFHNLLCHLRCASTGVKNVFGYNEFTGRCEIVNPAPWHKGIMPRHVAVTDNDLKMLKAHLATKHHFEMPTSNIEEAIVVVAHANKFHPVREYLEGLKWDEKPRLDNWLRDFCGAADDEYTKACARKTLCAAVMRAFRPGCKFDHVLVLEGEQGIGKSAVCQILGGEWYGDFSVDPHNKDTIQLLQGKWIEELSELEVTRRSDADALKAFVSRQVDTARLAYGRFALEFPRQSIFIATKNPGVDGTYLKDDTGNRRWWPVALAPKGGMVDFKGLKNARNQLFAEAMVRVRAEGGERLDMDTPELKLAAKIQAKKRHADHEWTERIALWLEGLPPERDFVTSRDVFLDAMSGVDKQFDRKSGLAIASVLRGLGWTRSVKRFGRVLVTGFARPDDGALGDLAK